MGVVYRAQQIALEREVAVKFLKSHGDEDEARFMREGKILAALSCPQILRVLDADAEEGRLWLVCELITGENLHERHSRLPLTTGQVFDVVHEVAKALEVAHATGIVHRDVKPENVILSPDGGVKLADFGLARDVRSVESLTTSGVVLGTPHFIAPEQVRGHAAAPAADQYALAVLLYWLLTGTHPIDGPTALEIMMQKCSVVPAPAHTVTNRVPRALSAVLEKALAIEPADRFASVAELGAELERVRHSLKPRATDVTRALVDPPRGPGLTRGMPEQPRKTNLTRALNEPSRAIDLPLGTDAPRVISTRRGLALIAIALIVLAGGLGLRRAYERGRGTGAPVELAARAPRIGAGDISFRRVGGAPCLAVRAPVSTGLSVTISDSGGRIGLAPVVGEETLCYRVDPRQILGPVTLEITAVDGTASTTSVTWPGLLDVLATEAATIARARSLVSDERLMRLSEDDLRGELPRIHSAWARISLPLHDVAPVLLDQPGVPLERKLPLFAALSALRLLDRIARSRDYAPLLPDDVLGSTFAPGLPDGAALYVKRAFESPRPLAVGTPLTTVLDFAAPMPDVLTELLVPPPPSGTKPRALLEVATGPLGEMDVVWLKIGTLRVPLTSDNRVQRNASAAQRNYSYQSLDARIFGARGTLVQATMEVLPGKFSRTMIRSLDRVGIYYP